MQCDRTGKFIDAYMDGELEATPLVEFEQHLADCVDCANALHYARLLKQGVRQQLEKASAPMPESLRARIASALDNEVYPTDQRSGQWSVRRSMWGFAAAAAVLLAVIGSFVYSGLPGGPGAWHSSRALKTSSRTKTISLTQIATAS